MYVLAGLGLLDYRKNEGSADVISVKVSAICKNSLVFTLIALVRAVSDERSSVLIANF